MTDFQLPDLLRQHRSLLLACETIGWLHMTNKANTDFLRRNATIENSVEIENQDNTEGLFLPWYNHLDWIKNKLAYRNFLGPDNIIDFMEKRTKNDPGLLGLLQASHAMASSIEKNLPSSTTEYLRQTCAHTWMSTAFGQPVRNLLIDQPNLFTKHGLEKLNEQLDDLLNTLKKLDNSPSGNNYNYSDDWWQWRESAIGHEGWLRKAFTSTLAETRLPNNDVTLFDQSYVAAALFKSAVAGAILESEKYPWDKKLKQKSRWRLLTIGIGTDHYEARAVKIGDWIGARQAIDDFFIKVRKLVEVDLAIGSFLYAEGGICVFSFPGELFDYESDEYEGDDLQINKWQLWLMDQIDTFTVEAELETPPYCRISKPSRSLVKMTAEIQSAREQMDAPLHRNWKMPDPTVGHVCPVCHVRSNGPKKDKQTPCRPCKNRRVNRLVKWLNEKSIKDTIWIDEVADTHDRLALATMSLDIEPWLDGTRLDALRSQAISKWASENTDKGLSNENYNELFNFFITAIGKGNEAGRARKKIRKTINPDFPDQTDSIAFFYSLIVDDRADAPEWKDIKDTERAAWFTHQFFRKLPSPGRIYRFQEQAKDFFKSLLDTFRQIVDEDQNTLRTKRLLIKPVDSRVQWKDQTIYNGHYGEVPISLLYRKEDQGFLTVCNIARLLKPGENKDSLKDVTLNLKEEDSENTKELEVDSIIEVSGALGEYYPMIPLDLSPVRFRVLLPLVTTSIFVEKAIEAWNNQFARVWDRLPLRVGVVAFPRMTPFQTVIEAVRNIEAELDKTKKPESWQVLENETQEKKTILTMKVPKQQQTITQTVPFILPDGRKDVFYPYLAVNDNETHFPLDFKHPDGRVFRHVTNLKQGDKIDVYPALIATCFLDNSSRRFEPFCSRYLNEWHKMRKLWQSISEYASSQAALRGTWSEIIERREAWKGPNGKWLEGGKEAWLDFAYTILRRCMDFSDDNLEKMLIATGDGLLDWSLEWHINILKLKVDGGKQ